MKMLHTANFYTFRIKPHLKVSKRRFLQLFVGSFGTGALIVGLRPRVTRCSIGKRWGIPILKLPDFFYWM